MSARHEPADGAKEADQAREFSAELAPLAAADVTPLTALSGLRELTVKGLLEGQVEAVRGLLLSSLSSLTKLEFGISLYRSW